MCSILNTDNEKKNKILDLNKELHSRKKKLIELRLQGFSFPNNFYRNCTLKQLNDLYKKKSDQELKKINVKVKVAGRIIFLRHIGKVSFVVLQDAEERIQLYVSSKEISKTKFDTEFRKVDLGDILGAQGTIFKTKTKELSIRCENIVLLVKSIRPFPSKFHGLNDPNIRYKKRYLDLIFNNDSYQKFKLRSQIVLEIRNFMQKNDFIEVETPILQSKPGGAIARSFVTHHYTLNQKMYLRIAPELYLKRLIIGRFEKIFEISKNFRNEGISVNHSPEFTMLELYIAYATYYDLMFILEKLIRTLTKKIFGTYTIEYFGEKIDFSKNFIKMTMKESICFIHKIKQDSLEEKRSLLKISKFLNVSVDDAWSLGRIQAEIFEKTVENKLIQPTFITSYPIEISPLARRNDKNPSLTERFEFFIYGVEIGNGFSELNDFEDQKKRFKEQIKLKSLNKKNAESDDMFYDEEYITALEYGLPPTAGLGIGIDRLVMILTNSKNIRDVILFPNLYSDKRK